MIRSLAFIPLLAIAVTLSFCQSGAHNTERTSTSRQAIGASSAPPIAMVTGALHGCALLGDGTVQCWGDNGFGEMGQGTFGGNYSTPVVVPGLTGVTSVASSSFHTCALLSDSTMKCWGWNAHGQLGNPAAGGESPTPVAVSGLTGAVAISAGGDNTCAVLSGGTVECWGDNTYGELGTGSTAASSSTPAPVAGLSGAIAVVTSADHSCALLSGGTVQCWGYNGYGNLGIGTQTGPTSCAGGNACWGTPAPAVSGLSNVAALATGDASHTCALLSGGTVQCWGYNAQGQLGNNSTTLSALPVPAAVTNAIAIGAGQSHSCAVLSNGSVQCWGSNANGQLGNGTTNGSPTPVTVLGVTGATAVHGGLQDSCALLSGGGIDCWGSNAFGQLGNGNTTNSPTPVAVLGFFPTPLVDCVIPPVFGMSAIAVFGYVSPLSAPVTIPGGSNNTLSPASPGGRVPGPVFQPGAHHSIFQTVFYGSTITWTLANQSATATAGSSPACTPAIYANSGTAGLDPTVSLIETGHTLPNQPGTIFVDVDNPVFSYPVTLGIVFSPNSNSDVTEEIVTDATSGLPGTNFRHTDFFIRASGETSMNGGFSTLPSMTDVLYPWTGQTGDLQAPSTTSLFSPGLRIGYKPMTLTTIKTTNDLSEHMNSPTIQVALDPNTLLVPIQVAVLYSDNFNLTDPNSPVSVYNADNEQTFWDDSMQLSNASTITEPVSNGSPELISVTRDFPQAGSTLKDSTGRLDPFEMWAPDSIWSKCGIQFRIVNFIAIPTDDDHVNPPDSVCQNTVFGNSEFTAISNDFNTLVSQDPAFMARAGTQQMPTIIFAARCTCPSFATNFGDPENAAFKLPSVPVACWTLQQGLNAHLTAAHELGHILGLDDAYNVPGACVPGAPTAGVMCSRDDFPVPTASECTTARRFANAYQSFWQ